MLVRQASQPVSLHNSHTNFIIIIIIIIFIMSDRYTICYKVRSCSVLRFVVYISFSIYEAEPSNAKLADDYFIGKFLKYWSTRPG